ncbi:hypothetical protein [Demequina aurantiaca]|uniref:hypothetical protein n=1 Tax=Demequina aurantiaca TaxID=676200 RepID=UPI003D33FE10
MVRVEPPGRLDTASHALLSVVRVFDVYEGVHGEADHKSMANSHSGARVQTDRVLPARNAGRQT